MKKVDILDEVTEIRRKINLFHQWLIRNSRFFIKRGILVENQEGNMRFATSFEHRDFFSKNGYIEFADLIPLAECELLLSNPAGFDLWRENPLIKKISLRPQLAELASILLLKKTLRIGFDQRLNRDEIPELTNSCLKPIICLFLILSGEKAGHGLFFKPENLPHLTAPVFLISYCDVKTFYLLNKRDPYTHAPKKLGYVFGDLLRNDTHPLIFLN